MADNLTQFPITTKKVSEYSTASALGGTEIINCIQSSLNKKATINQIQTKILTDKLFHVSELSDLPNPVSGVITLVSNSTYLITSQVDLEGNRIIASEGNVIIGLSTDVSKLFSTGLTGNALITSNYSLSMRFITLEAETPFNLDASSNANQTLNWEGVNLENCTNAGTIKTYDNFIGRLIGVINGAGFIFDGTIGTIGFIDTIFDTSSSKIALSLATTLTITRRVRITNSSFVIASGETGINVVSGATIPDEGLILNVCNFSGGGTYLNGITSSDDEARFMENRGVSNSISVSHYYMTGNATATTIASSGTYYKILGTTTSGDTVERFNVATNNRAIYTSSLTQSFKISVSLSFTGTNNDDIRFRIAKNGTTLLESQIERTIEGTGSYANLALQDIVELETNDYIEVFVTNQTNTHSVTINNLSVIISKV